MVKDSIALVLLGLGAFFFLTSTVGLFRFPCLLSRMHAVAVGDTVGMLMLVVGLCLLRGISVASAKIVLTLVFLWLTGPVTTHLLARLELETNPKAARQCEEEDVC